MEGHIPGQVPWASAHLTVPSLQEEAAAQEALLQLRTQVQQEHAGNEQRWAAVQAAQDEMVDLKVGCDRELSCCLAVMPVPGSTTQQGRLG